MMGDLATRYTGDISTLVSGPYAVLNNAWGTEGLAQGWSQQVGVSGLKADNSVDFRLKWNFPTVCCGKEVLSFPEIVYGVASSDAVTAPGAKLPRRFADLNGLVTRYSGISGTVAGSGHLAYDLWTTKAANGALTNANADTEIIIPTMPINGYGVPNWPIEATVGREGQIKQGRNPYGYLGRVTLSGGLYDLYRFPANSTHNHSRWQFIVFEPLVFTHMGANTLDWMPFLNYILNQGWIERTDYLANVELGVETEWYQGVASGDLTIKDFRVDVN
jgi:Glycosyl hydrolase family 12